MLRPLANVDGDVCPHASLERTHQVAVAGEHPRCSQFFLADTIFYSCRSGGRVVGVDFAPPL